MRARQPALGRSRPLGAAGRGRREGPQPPVPPAHADGQAVPLGHLQLALSHRAGTEPGGPLSLLAARQGTGRLVHHQRHDLRARQSPRLRPLGANGPPRMVLRRSPAGFLPLRRAPGAEWGLPRDGRRAHGLPRAWRQSAFRRVRRGGAPSGSSRQRRLQRGRQARRLRPIRLHHQAGQAMLSLHRLPQPDPTSAQSGDPRQQPGAPRERGGGPRHRDRGRAAGRRANHPRRARGHPLCRHGQLAPASHALRDRAR